MKILQIIAAYKPAYVYGGPTMSASMLSEQLQAAGITVAVYTTTANGKTELSCTPDTPVEVDGVTVTYFKRITKDHTHFSPALLHTLWKTVQQYDAVHIHAWWNLVSVFSCLIALIKKVPVVVSPRGTLSPYAFNHKSSRYKKLFHHSIGLPLLNRCHLHVTSPLEHGQIQALLRPRSISLIPNFVKFNPAPLPHREPGKILQLLFLSRIHPKKGLDLLISALPMLDFLYRLTIAGSGDEAYVASLKALASRIGVTDYIEWAGFQQQNKFELLAGHDVLALPSYDENFGNVVIESLSEGTAVLAGSGVGLAQYVTDNHSGWQCAPQADAIAYTLNHINRQRPEMLRIQKEAPLLVRKDYDVQHLIEQYRELYIRVACR